MNARITESAVIDAALSRTNDARKALNEEPWDDGLQYQLAKASATIRWMVDEASVPALLKAVERLGRARQAVYSGPLSGLDAAETDYQCALDELNRLADQTVQRLARADRQRFLAKALAEMSTGTTGEAE